VRRLAAAYLLWYAERYGQFPPGAAGTIDEQIERAELYVKQNPGGPPRSEVRQVAEQHLDELLAALRLPNIWALFDAIGRDALPGETVDERAEIRHLAACVLLDTCSQVGALAGSHAHGPDTDPGRRGRPRLRVAAAPGIRRCVVDAEKLCRLRRSLRAQGMLNRSKCRIYRDRLPAQPPAYPARPSTAR
jgi:hypothetical protein